MSSGFSHRAYVACGSVSYMGLMASYLKIFCLFLYWLLFFLLFSVVYYNLEHPDKNRVLKFLCISRLRYWTMTTGFSHCAYVACGSVSYDGSHGLLPEDLLPVSAVTNSSLAKLGSCTRLRNP